MLVRKFQRKTTLGDLDIDERIILKFIIKF
jgi:hypothetical protein